MNSLLHFGALQIGTVAMDIREILQAVKIMTSLSLNAGAEVFSKTPFVFLMSGAWSIYDNSTK